jgi:nucleotide-binding universal stress UspA family protein
MNETRDSGNPSHLTQALVDGEALYRPCDPEALDFETTDEVGDSIAFVGQDRAAASVRFGIGMRGDGFNIFALGPEDTDKREIVKHFLEERAGEEPVPDELCYLNNFEDSNQPKAVCLPPGEGRKLAEMMDGFASELVPALATVFEGEEYQGRLQGIVRRIPKAKRELRERIRSLDREMARSLVRDLLEEFRGAFADNGEVQEHLKSIEEDVADHLDRLKELGRTGQGSGSNGTAMNGVVLGQRASAEAEPQGAVTPEHPLLRRYRVNVAVDHGESEHAPVVYLDHPTYQNLAGSVEYQPFQGALVTDFNLIRPGALDRAILHTQIRWSFKMSRGRVVSELLEAASSADLISLGVRRHSLARGPGSTARAVLDRSGKPVIMVWKGARMGRRVCVLFDGSRKARKGLALACRLSQDRDAELFLILDALGTERERLMEAARSSLESAENAGAQVAVLPRVAGWEVARYLGALTCGLLVIPGTAMQRSEAVVAGIREGLACPLLILG